LDQTKPPIFGWCNAKFWNLDSEHSLSLFLSFHLSLSYLSLRSSLANTSMVWESGFRCVLHPSWLLLHYTHYQPCVFLFCYFFLFVCVFASSFLSFLCLLIAFTLFVIVSCFCLTISSSHSCHNLFSVLLPSISSFNLQLVVFYVEIKSCPILKCHYSDFFFDLWHYDCVQNKVEMYSRSFFGIQNIFFKIIRM
jgi:hypothetical protein